MPQPVKATRSATAMRVTSPQKLTVDQRPMTTGGDGTNSTIGTRDGNYTQRHLNSPVSAPSSASSRDRAGKHHFFQYQRQSSTSPDYRSTPCSGPFIYRGLRHSAGGKTYLRTGMVNQIESDDDTINGSRDDVNQTGREEYTKRTKLTFLTESGNFNSTQQNKPPPGGAHETDCTSPDKLPGGYTCTDRMPSSGRLTNRISSSGGYVERMPSGGGYIDRSPSGGGYTGGMPSSGKFTDRSPSGGGHIDRKLPKLHHPRPHTVADCRRDSDVRRQGETQYIELPPTNGRPATSFNFTSPVRDSTNDLDRTTNDTHKNPHNDARLSVAKSASSRPEELRPESSWSGLREAIYANQENIQPDVIYNAGGIPVRDTLDTSSSVPWLDEYMGIKTKMSIQMAMSNSPNKGLRKLGCRTARNRKNPWKDREREIWKNRHNCRVVNKPEVQLVEKTEEEKAKGVEKARRRLGWVFSVVYWTIHCFKTCVELSCSLTTRSGVEIQWHTLHSNKKLAFNPANFAKAKIQAKMPQWARTILEKPSPERTDGECRRLHAMMRGYPSFDKFTELIQLAMCRSLEYMFVHSQRIILREGHIGQNFYFVYSGSVFVNVTEYTTDGTPFIKTEAVLSKGDSFGELALLQDELRNATVSCRVDTELLMVDKEIFSTVCPEIFDTEMEEKLHFVGTLPLFHTNYWDKDALYRLCFESQIQQYMTNKVICRNSRDDSWMYICIQGSCHVIKCLNLDKDTDSTRAATSQEEDDEIQLTAEFLDTMDKHAARAKGRTERRSSVNQELFKKRMLDSLSLEYVKTVNKQQKKQEDSGDSNGLVGYTEELSTNPDASITMTSLMRQGCTQGKNVIYLKIGRVQPGEVFDLAEILQPSRVSASNDLILVSGGAQVFRVRRNHLHNIITPEALEHAKHLAKKNIYPSETTLLSSYKTESKWMNYREQVVVDAMGNQARRKNVQELQQKGKSAKKMQDSKLLSTLHRNQQREQRRLDFMKRISQPEGMALDTVHIPDQDDEYFTVECNQGKLDVTQEKEPVGVPSSARRGSRSIPKPIRTKCQVTIQVEPPNEEDTSGHFEEVD